MNNPFIISSCKTYTTYSEFFIVSQNVIAFPHHQIIYVPMHHVRPQALTSSNCDRYMRSAKCTSTDRVIKCDDRPIPISGRSIGASLIQTQVKKARQRLYHLRQLRKFRVSPTILKTFYSGTIESVLSASQCGMETAPVKIARPCRELCA